MKKRELVKVEKIKNPQTDYAGVCGDACIGANCGIRTHDLCFTKALLYP